MWWGRPRTGHAPLAGVGGTDVWAPSCCRHHCTAGPHALTPHQEGCEHGREASTAHRHRPWGKPAHTAKGSDEIQQAHMAKGSGAIGRAPRLHSLIQSGPNHNVLTRTSRVEAGETGCGLSTGLKLEYYSQLMSKKAYS